MYRGTSLIRNSHPPPGPPQGPRDGPTVGFHGNAASNDRGTPAVSGLESGAQEYVGIVEIQECLFMNHAQQFPQERGRFEVVF